MILQINNDNIVANLTILNAIENPSHGNCYFVTSEECAYSYYNTPKNETEGAWSKDRTAVLYTKAESLNLDHIDVTSFYPNVLLSDNEEVIIEYDKHELSGILYFKEIRAGLVIDFRTGNKTNFEVFQIEAMLKPIKELVKEGDWLTAQWKIPSIIPVGDVNIAFHAKVTNYINDYITNNY